MAGVPAAAEAASRLGMEFLPGIEITAILERRDVHVLAYFLDPAPAALQSFLETQREIRVDRARRMATLLGELGAPIDVESSIEMAVAQGRSIARPTLARALVDAGHVRSVKEAFDRWIGDGRPAHVPREGSTPAEVVRLVSKAGGVSARRAPGSVESGRAHSQPRESRACSSRGVPPGTWGIGAGALPQALGPTRARRFRLI